MAADANLVVVFPDGRQVESRPGTSAGELIAAWSPESAGHALAALWNGKPVDLAFRVAENGSLAPLTFEDRAGWEVLQHSSAHLVAKAVVETIPDALPTHGPPTDDGFFYDFDVRPLTPGDLDAIGAAMKRSVAASEPFSRRELDRTAAERLFAHNPYKLRYIADTPPGEPVSVYDTGTFTDLCRGPHVPNAHWLRGVHVLGFSAITADRPEAHPLQRIRGVGFPTRPELDQYLKIRAEAVARDHRTIGQRQELFVFADHAPGFPFWLPNGMVIIRELEKFVQEHLRKGRLTRRSAPRSCSPGPCSRPAGTGTTTGKTCSSRSSRARSTAGSR